MSEHRASEYPDLDLPGNDLDPRTITPAQRRKISLPLKIYGLLCLIDGIITIPAAVIFVGVVIWALSAQPDLVSVGSNSTLTISISVASFIVAVINAVCLIAFGRSLLKNHRRWAARWSHALLALTVVQLLLDVMLQGIGVHLIRTAIQLLILLVVSVGVDPSLRQERALKRRLRDLEDREAAAVGMLGRDREGKGFIELNFFNLFWVFVVCSVLGLVIETVYHMVIVEPGVYQDRAGMLFGPFSPIYGVGAMLMTIALNRFYRSNPLIIFAVSAVIGGVFECLVSWFMQTSFGAVAWDYTGMTILGLPDPIATIAQGRTSTPFMLMWGALGLVWIRFCLPRLLTLINKIPWKIRYSFTSFCALLMFVNAVMTFQALDCWFERLSGIAPTSAIAEFYATNFDDDYMEQRFQSMTITPDDSTRVDTGAVVDATA